MIDCPQLNGEESSFSKTQNNKISSNRVFDSILTEGNICPIFKLNFCLQNIKYRFTNE